MKGISLPSVLQVINLERQSCDIHAQADGRLGQLHFRDGNLVDAAAEDLVGEDAAYAILGWKNPEFEVSSDDAPRDRSIEADLTHLLLETARRQDEQEAGFATADPAPSAGAAQAEPLSRPEPAPRVEPAPLVEPASPAEPVPFAGPAPHAEAETAATAVEAEPQRGPGALNAAALKRVIDIARDGVGEALISADVYSKDDGTSYVGVNSMPAACALFNQVTGRIGSSLDKSGLPALGRYYMAELADAKLMLVAPCGPCQLNLIVDSSRVQLGLLLNVILPEVLSALEEVGGG
jgi:hypothetical protein